MEFVNQLRALGKPKILDLAAAASAHGMLQPWIHDGVYYILPPDGCAASEIDKLLKEAQERGEVHFIFNAQSSIDIAHKPLLPMDSFANRYFGESTTGGR